MTNEEFDRALGKRLRIARFKLGISEVEAADAFGVTLKTYRKWETGGNHMRSAVPLLRFAKQYDVPMDWLLAGRSEYAGQYPTLN